MKIKISMTLIILSAIFFGCAVPQKKVVTEKPVTKEPKEKPSGALQKVESNNFTFELTECKMSGTSVTCHLLITNKARKERRIYIGGERGTWVSPSFLYDNVGNQYKGREIQFGAQKYRRAV